MKPSKNAWFLLYYEIAIIVGANDENLYNEQWFSHPSDWFWNI